MAVQQYVKYLCKQHVEMVASKFQARFSPYPGMLSKSKGEILRVAAVLHVLFHIDMPLSIPETKQ